MDPDRLACILTTRYEEHKLLITVNEEKVRSRLILPASTQKYLRDVILPDKLLRRAFLKAIRQSFIWGHDSTVTLFPDYDGFFFREDHGICGGLIISRYQVGAHEAVRFSIHT